MLANSAFTISLGLLASSLLITGVQGGLAQTTATLSASATSIPLGQSSTLAWTSANATACSGTGEGFSPSGPSGSLAVSPRVTTAYTITCIGAGGAASQSATVAVTGAQQLTIGMTVPATETVYAHPTPSTKMPQIGAEAKGNQGAVIGGPVSGKNIWWQVAFDDDLTGWVVQSGLAAVSPTAPTLWLSASPVSIAPGASSTLSWSSTNATACSGTGFSPTGVSGSVSVSPAASTTYTITCTGSGGSTTQSAAVVVTHSPACLGASRSRSLSTILRSFLSEARRAAPCSSWTEVCMRELAIGKILSSRILRPRAPRSCH